MKHATAATLALLQPLLAELRKLGRLTERTPGCFYLGSKAFLHFHGDASGTYADVKLDLAEFTRLRVSSPEEQTDFLQRVRRCLRGR